MRVVYSKPAAKGRGGTPPAKAECPRRFMLNNTSAWSPDLPIFSKALPTFVIHMFNDRRRYYSNMSILRITVRKKSHFSVCQKCFVAQKYVKNALRVGAPPQTSLGELTTLSPSQAS